MSDQKLRDLERRWKETGSPDDEAAYLLERVRVGDLSRERLELAAYCGHEAAGRVCGQAAPSQLAEFVGGLEGWPDPVQALAALALASVALEVWSRWPDSEEFEGPANAVAALRKWLACPCESCALGCRRGAEEAGTASYEAHLSSALRAENAAGSVAWCALVVVTPGLSNFWKPGFAPSEGAAFRRAVQFAIEAGVSPTEVIRVVRAALTDWAIFGRS